MPSCALAFGVRGDAIARETPAMAQRTCRPAASTGRVQMKVPFRSSL